MSGPGVLARLEAILLVAEQPVSAAALRGAVVEPAESLTTEQVHGLLVETAAAWEAEGRGIALRELGGGWRLHTAERCSAQVARFLSEQTPARLSPAALETLAVVAYQQPTTRGRVAAVRGVAVDAAMRTLVARGLVETDGTDGPGGAHRYRTTPLFLELLGLRSLAELPPLAPLLPGLDDLPADDPAGSQVRLGRPAAGTASAG